jgi:hypothetical protein
MLRVTEQQGDQSATQAAVGRAGELQQQWSKWSSRACVLLATPLEIAYVKTGKTVDEIVLLVCFRVCRSHATLLLLAVPHLALPQPPE